MLDSVHDTYESKTWVPNVCPQIHPACGPLQNMQASRSSALGHCVSVIAIMPPSPLSTAFSCPCTWYGGQLNAEIHPHPHLPLTSPPTTPPTTPPTPHPPPPPPTPIPHHHHPPPSPTHSSLPTTNHYIFIFAIQNEAYLGLPIYQF